MADEIQKNSAGAVESAPEENKPVEVKAEVKEEIKAPKKVKNTMVDIENALLAENNNSEKFPKFNIGDTVKVYVKIIEGEKQRIQPYEGVVIAMKHGGSRKSFTVRRISYGVAIERVFPFHSPYIDRIEQIRKGRVRRAKLYYLRGRFGRSAVITEKV